MGLIVQETLLLQPLMAVLRTVFVKKQVRDGIKIGQLGLMVQTPSNHLVCLVRYLTNALEDGLRQLLSNRAIRETMKEPM
jgi:hypothetical protein